MAKSETSSSKAKSTRAKGNATLLKTKKWLESEGYSVEKSESFYRVFLPGGKILFKKKDVFGADLIAMNGKEIIFVQSKRNGGDIAAGIREFHQYPYPEKAKAIRRWVVTWELRAHEPTIEEL